MSKKQSLEAKRNTLIKELKDKKYRSLVEITLEGVGRMVQRMTRGAEPPSVLYNALILLLFTLLIGAIISLSLNETLLPEMLLLGGWAGLLGSAVMIQARAGTRLLLTTLKESTVPAIENFETLDLLQRWLRNSFNIRKQLVFTVIISLLIGASAPLFWSALRGGFPGWGPVIGVVLVWLQAGMGWYFVSPMLTWVTQLSQYRLKLYHADPSNSEVIDRLADVLNFLVFTSAILAALFTLGLLFFELLNPSVTFVFLVVGSWGPIVSMFIISQYALARIITKAKWQKLSEIQRKIEQLEQEQDIADKAVMEAMNRLMDYHDRIQGTRESALNLRAGLNFLNSLLLPLFAFILGNLEQVLAFFS